MKQLYLTLAAAAAVAFSSFGAKAFTVDEIVGTYNATNMNFTENCQVFSNGFTVSGLESVSWEMTISAVEGNKVKLTNFIKKGINNGVPDADGVFDIEGEFDPQTNTITFQPTYYEFRVPASGGTYKRTTNIAKKTGTEVEAGLKSTMTALESFNATFDEQKNLTVEPWGMFSAKFFVHCLPAYELNGEKKWGTYFTPAGGAGLNDLNFDENAPVEYFNLQGMKVENPENGMFIRRQGKKVQKVIIR